MNLTTLGILILILFIVSGLITGLIILGIIQIIYKYCILKYIDYLYSIKIFIKDKRYFSITICSTDYKINLKLCKLLKLKDLFLVFTKDFEINKGDSYYDGITYYYLCLGWITINYNK